MCVEVSHADVVIMEVKKMLKVRCEIRRTTGYGGYVNILNVDRYIVDGGCDGEVLSDVVGRENGVWRYVDERDRVVNECEKSSTTRVTRSLLPYSGVIWEGDW